MTLPDAQILQSFPIDGQASQKNLLFANLAAGCLCHNQRTFLPYHHLQEPGSHDKTSLKSAAIQVLQPVHWRRFSDFSVSWLFHEVFLDVWIHTFGYRMHHNIRKPQTENPSSAHVVTPTRTNGLRRFCSALCAPPFNFSRAISLLVALVAHAEQQPAE